MSLHLQSEADVIKYAKEMEVAPPTGAKMKQVMDAIKRGATDMELIPMITGRRFSNSSGSQAPKKYSEQQLSRYEKQGGLEFVHGSSLAQAKSGATVHIKWLSGPDAGLIETAIVR